jgi:hypothetical protein
VLVRGGVAVGAGVVGAAVGAVVVGAAVGVVEALDVALGVGLGVAVVGAAVRIWIVGLGDAEALGEGDGDAVVPASRENPPPRSTPIRRSVRRPPATAARIRSIQRGPRRGGGMIFVASDIGRSNRRLRAEQTYARS